MPQIGQIICFLIDRLTLIYLLDLISFYLFSTTLITSIQLTLNLSKWSIFSYLFKKWLIFRCLLFSWKRYQVYKRLKKKKDDILDKHSRLYNKFQGLHNNPNSHAEIQDLNNNKNNNNNEMTALSLSQLREKLDNKSLLSIDLLDAYQVRALELVRSKLNCITEIIYEADVYAILADSIRDSESGQISLIYGIPIAVEEIFPIHSYDHTMGYTICTNHPAEDDCILVKALHDCGAVPVILTNVKQQLLSLTANNPITGLTSHPTHPGRVCVSGTASLLAHNGCPIALGIDILGEARLSASFCGKAAFKPTSGRMSVKDLKLPIELPDYLPAVPSPIGHKIEDLVDILRSLWTKCMFSHDLTLPPIVFNNEKYQSILKSERKLKIGFYIDFDNLVNSSSSIQRVMLKLRDDLQRKGHEVIDFKLPTPYKAYELTISLLAKYVEPELLKLLYIRGNGDILIDYKQRLLHLFYTLPKFFQRRISEWRAKCIEGDYPATAVVLRGLGCNKSHKTLMTEINNYKQQVFSQWNEAELDVLVCPTSPIPAPWNDCSSYVTNCILPFTCLYNLLDCPSGTVYAGRVEKCDLQVCDDNLNGSFKISPTNRMYSEQYKLSEGLPIGIQVVGKPWDDETALGLLVTLQSLFN